MGGGGGTQGEVAFPDYIDAFMEEFLGADVGISFGDDLDDLIYTATSSNPFDPAQSGHEFEDPDNYMEFGAVGMEDPGSYYDNSLRPAVDGQPSLEVTSRLGDGDSFVTQILDHIDNIQNAGGLAQSAIDTGYDAAEDASMVGDAESDIAPEADWSSYLHKAATELDIELNDIDTDALATAARDGSVTQIGKVISNSSPSIDHESVGEGIMTKAKDVADTAGMLEEVNWQSVFNAAKSAATDEVSAAVTKASDVVDSQPIEDAVDAHRRRIEGEYEDRVGEFTAGMADISAVNSSAFSIGLALIRAEHNQDVSDYDARLSLQMFQQAMQMHLNGLQVSIESKLRTELANKQSREQFIQTTAELVSNVYAQARQLQSIFARLQQQGYQSRLDAEVQGASQEKQSRDQLLQEGAQSILRLKQLEQQYKQFIGQVMENFAEAQLQAEMQTSRMDFQRDVKSVGLAHELSMKHWGQVMAERQNSFNQLMANTAAFLEAHNQYTSSELARGAKKQKWELDMWEKGVNMLAAPSGMARSLPEGQSKAQGAIGGALKGAGTGAAVGAASGTPFGAGAGALVGGLMGGVSGYVGA